MIKQELDRANAVLWVHPAGPLAREDYKVLASVVAPFIEERGMLARRKNIG